MQKRKSFPFTMPENISRDFHCFAPRHMKKGMFSYNFFLNILFVLIFFSVVGYLVKLGYSEYQNMKNKIISLQNQLDKKEENMGEWKISQKLEISMIKKEIESLINVIDIYTEQKKMIEEVKSNQSLNIESNLEILKNDLIVSVQHYLATFYLEVFSKDLQKEQSKMIASIKTIENVVFNLVDSQKTFEERFNTFNIADLQYGAQIIKYDFQNITWTTSSYESKLSILHYFDQFTDVDLLIDSYNDFKKCFHAYGDKGIITIQLKDSQYIFGFSYEHKLNGKQDFDSLKIFQVFGLLDNEGKDPFESYDQNSSLNGYYLGSYYFTAGKLGKSIIEYDILKQNYWKYKDGNRFKQYYICNQKNCQNNKFKTIRIEYDNYGDISWTCLYKFEIFVKKSFHN